MKKARRSNAPSPDEKIASPTKEEIAVEGIEDGGEVGEERGEGREEGKLEMGKEATGMEHADAEGGGSGGDGGK